MFGLVRKISSKLIVPAGWTLLTILLLSLPGSAIPDVNIYEVPHVDKIVHFVLFGGIPMLWSFYMLPKSNGVKKSSKASRIIIGFCLFSILLGIVMEYIQFYFIANRDFDIIDIVADSLGAICFAILVLVIERKSNSKEVQG